MRQTFENTKPGGWAEFQDFYLDYYSQDGSMKSDCSLQIWITTLLSAIRDMGRDPSPGVSLEKWLRDAGFVNVEARKFPLPIGPWPKDKHLVSFLIQSWLNPSHAFCFIVLVFQIGYARQKS